MNTNQLEIFYHVARFESITKASDYLRISQPAVSTHIKKLETYYGVQLFTKSGRGIKLSPLGEQVYTMITPFFVSTLNAVEALLSDTQHLKVYGNYLMTQFVLPQALKDKKHTDRIIIKSMSSSQALDDLINNRCDLALVSSSEVLLLDETLVAEPLFDDTIVYIRNKKADLNNMTLITSKSKRDIKDLVINDFPQISKMANIDVETTQDVIANLHVNQNIASFVSSKFLEYTSDEFYIEKTSVSTRFYSIYRRSTSSYKQIDALIKTIKENL